MNSLDVPFLEAVQDVSAGNVKIPKADFLEFGDLAIVDQGKSLIAGYTDESYFRVNTEPPLIIFGDHTRTFKYIDFPFAMGADGVKVLRVRDGFDPKFVYYFLRSRELPNAGYSRHFKYLKDLRIPQLEINAQRRIATILDTVQNISSQRQRTTNLYESLKQSSFQRLAREESWRAVSPAPPTTSSNPWEWVRLSEVATMSTGHTPDRERGDYWGGEIAWISLPEIRKLDGATAQDTDIHVTPAGIENSSAVILPTQTVCFSRTASIGFVTKMGRPMATSQDFHNWTPGPSLNADYLMAALRYSRAHLLGASDGSTHKTIYQRTAERFHILLPPLERQREFAALNDQIDARLATVQKASAIDDELFASLQARAFRGEL